MHTYHIIAKMRTVRGKQVRQLRKTGTMPAVVYSKGDRGRPIELSEIEFMKVFRVAGSSSLIDLEIEGKIQPVLVSEVAYDPMSSKPLHVDFQLVDMKQRLKTRIPLQFVGESRAVKEAGGILVKVLDSLEVECLPSDLVPHLDVLLVKLEKISDMIRISDLGLPSTLRVLANADEVIAAVEMPKAEELVKVAVASAEPEVVGKSEKKGKESDDVPETTDKKTEKK